MANVDEIQERYDELKNRSIEEIKRYDATGFLFCIKFSYFTSTTLLFVFTFNYDIAFLFDNLLV